MKHLTDNQLLTIAYNNDPAAVVAARYRVSVSFVDGMRRGAQLVELFTSINPSHRGGSGAIIGGSRNAARAGGATTPTGPLETDLNRRSSS